MSPALDQNGRQIFSDSLHLYKVFETALTEDFFYALEKREEIIVYNDSRIIDEINGNIIPIIKEHEQFKNLIRRDILPEIMGIVFFRKCSKKFLDSMIQKGHEKMLNKLSPEDRLGMIKKLIESKKQISTSRNQRILSKFKERLHDGTPQRNPELS
jgi:hypothetical protein